ncbi:MAG: ELM1/GtrOC1 family putative glycosyltransferase [Candidatus Omnitrophota bacterium]
MGLSLWMARRAGELMFLCFRARGDVAYTNIRACLGTQMTPEAILRMERRLFQNLMQTGVEVLRFPKVDRAYLDRYVTFHGFERLDEAKKKGKGLIALTAHFGNWELQSVASALRGHPLHVLAREQKLAKTNALLDRYRELTGCRVIQKGFMTREIIRHLRDNGIVGILTDQDAGKNGVFVRFFGRPTSFAPGPIAFALKTGCEVIPCFIRRTHHAHHVIEVMEPLQAASSGDDEADIRKGLQQFADRLEHMIRKYPDQWLWFHKRWKSSPTRNVALLSDGKAGHLNQSLGVASALEQVLRQNGKTVASQDKLEIRYKRSWRRAVITFLSLQSNRRCRGCLKCVRWALTPESYESLIRARYDFIVSTGSGLAPLNRILSKDHGARSIVVMDPVLPGAAFFDLAVIPEHDRPKPASNIVTTSGAPHCLTDEVVQREGARLLERIGRPATPFLGLLVGGDTEEFRWIPESFSKVLEKVKAETRARGFQMLVTSSRRTSQNLESLLEKALKGDPLCRLLVLANRMNVEGIVPAILGISKLVLVTGESISMVSEAASVAERVIVLLPERRKKNSKLEKTLSVLAKNNQILLAEEDRIQEVLCRAFQTEQARLRLDDAERIREGLGRIV